MTPFEVETFERYKPKAQKGEAVYEYLLGQCYADGNGTIEDDVEAAIWFKKAAHQDVPEAQAKMGRCYSSGHGVVRDLIEAYAYYNLAAVRGKVWRSELDILELSMTREAVLRAQERTRELQKEIEAKMAAKKAGK